MKILIVGATSAIAQETAKHFAREQAELFLIARDKTKVEAVAADLIVRGAGHVASYPLDVTHIDALHAAVQAAVTDLQGLDAVLIAHGSLSDQRACEDSVAETLQEFRINCLSVIALLTIVANYFERQGTGCIAVISSVAGDRGRRSNYVYGAAKGAVSIFLEGLRSRLVRAGVSVVTIKPGFVDTPMTAHMKKNALFATPEAVGKRIYEVIKHPRDVLYVPWFWRPVMSFLRHVPHRVYKQLPF